MNNIKEILYRHGLRYGREYSWVEYKDGVVVLALKEYVNQVEEILIANHIKVIDKFFVN